MVPASLLVGVCAAPLWAAQSSYLTLIGKEYASINKQKPQDVIPFLFGIFLMITFSATLFSSIISSLVLQQATQENYTGPSYDDLALCGINDCPTSNVTNINLQKPAKHLVWTLVGIYIFIAIIGFIVSVVCVDELPVHLAEDRETGIQDTLKASCMQMIQPKQLMLIPITVYVGLAITFKSADWTKSYITCNIGIWMIGYTTIPYAIFAAVVSFLSGCLVKVMGRIPIFCVFTCAELGLLLTYMLWKPDPEEYSLFFVLSGLGGIGSGVLETQIKALYGFIFLENSEAAFSCLQFWISVGFIMAFAYSSHLCTRIKLYILLTFLLMGMMLYGITEWKVQSKKPKPIVNIHLKEQELEELMSQQETLK